MRCVMSCSFPLFFIAYFFLLQSSEHCKKILFVTHLDTQVIAKLYIILNALVIFMMSSKNGSLMSLLPV